MTRLRAQCRDCAKRGRGGYFSIRRTKSVNEVKDLKCPYCGSTNIKLLSS